MKLVKLGDVLGSKYKVAQDQKHLKVQIRRAIESLYMCKQKSYSILSICASNGPMKSSSFYDSALLGHKFCQQVCGLIDDMQKDIDTISLSAVKDIVAVIAKLIEMNRGTEERQFMHVSDLISSLYAGMSHNDLRNKSALSQKARTGLARISSICIEMHKELRNLEEDESIESVQESMPERFKGQRKNISYNEMVKFIRLHGEAYGLDSEEELQKILTSEPELKEKLTTVINALRNGQIPKDGPEVKNIISELVSMHEEKAKTNQQVFEE